MPNLPAPKSPNMMVHVKNGHTYDRRVTAMMVEEMIFDPILAAKVLLDVSLPPHEELRILQMWTTNWTLDDSGFSSGKSFTYAVVSALRSLLFAGRISGVLSGTFRQGKLILSYYDRWVARSKIFRNCFKMNKGQPRIVHGQDLWEAHFRGTSTVRVLPPNFLQDSERLRSERWNDGYFDEWTTFGNFQALTSIIIGRCTAVNHYPECPVRQNHIHLCSTPSFTHHPAYKLVKQIDGNIKRGKTDYAHMTFNYRHIPRTKKYQSLVNRKVIFAMQTLNPPGVVEAEVNGRWTSDSLSYYSSAAIDDPLIRFDACVPHLKRPSTGKYDIYLAAFDMARGQESTSKAGGDDFALSVLRLPHGTNKAQYVLCVRKHNITAQQAAAIVHEYHQAFHFSMIGYDPGGGGLFVRDELKKPLQEIRGERQAVYPIIELGDISGSIGDMILIPIRRSALQIEMVWGKMTSASVLVNRIHKNMRTVLETKQFMAPSHWPGWVKLGFSPNKWEIDTMRQLLEQAAGISEFQRAWAEIDLSLKQLVTVDVERDENGSPKLDSHGQYKFKSSFRKDSAYSLIYVVLMKLLWESLREQGGLVQSTGGGEVCHYAGGSIFDA